MLQRSKFSNKMLIGLMSLGLVGAIATAPSSSSAAPTSDSTSQPSADMPGNVPAPIAPAPQSPAMTSQSESMAPQNRVSSQAGRLQPSHKVTERGGAIVAPGVNFSDYSDSRRMRLSLSDSSTFAPAASAMDSSAMHSSTTNSSATNSSATNSSATNSSAMENTANPPRVSELPTTPGSSVTNSTTERDDAVRVPEAGTAQTTDTRSQSLGQVVSDNADFSTLETAIKAAGLESAFEGTEPITVFAPTNAAFAALPADALKQLLLPENREALRQILTYHVVQGNLTSDAIQAGDVNTAEGSSVTFAKSSGKVMISGATVTQADIMTRNGVIHAIDKVLLPPDLKIQ